MNTILPYARLIRVISWVVWGHIAAIPSLALAELPRSVTQALAKFNIPESSLSVYISRLDDDKILLSHRADEARNPASVMKLVTSYAAMDLLGPDFAWKTGVYTDGQIKAGTLDGNLYLRGGGDPLLLTEDFWRLVFGLKQRGIQSVTGDLVLDASHFDNANIDRTALDGKTWRVYNAHPEALVVNFRATRFLFIPNGQNVEIVADPPATTLKIENRIRAITGGCRRDAQNLRFDIGKGKDGFTRVSFSGDYSLKCGESSKTLVVLPPLDYIGGVFGSLFETQGGEIAGGFRSGQVPEDARLILNHESRPLFDTLRGINKYSNNIMARTLLVTIGSESYDPPGTPETGRIAIQSWLNEQGISMPQLKIDNGAGLSRRARASAGGLGRLLEHLDQHPWRAEIQASMSLVGVDGSTRKRMRNNELRGQFRLKTGLLRNVRAVAGFGLTRRGSRIVIVVIQNDTRSTYHNGNAIQNRLLEWVYDNH